MYSSSCHVGAPSEASRVMQAPALVLVLLAPAVVVGQHNRSLVNTASQEDLFAGLKCQPGFDCTREEVSEDLRTLFQ